MEENKNRCNRCLEFQRYYIKGRKSYKETKFGRCCIKDCTVKSTESCDKFNKKCFKKRIPYSAENCLEGLLMEISELRKVLEKVANEKE